MTGTSTPGTMSPMDELPVLRRPVDEVRVLLTGRIESGQDLFTRIEMEVRAQSRVAYEDLEDDFHAWDRYNDALLRKLFDGTELAERYQRSKPIMMVRNLADDFNALRRRLQGALRELKATLELLELLDLEPEEMPRSSTDAERDAYFRLLCERTGGRTDQVVPSKDIGAAVGLTDTVRSDVEDFLRAEGLIEFVAMGPQVALTHAGRRRYEQGESAGTPPTSHTSTVIIQGDMTGGTIQQAGAHSKQRLEITSTSAIDAARQWIDELAARIDDQTLVFPGEMHDEADEHIQLLQVELANPDPERKRLKAGLRTVGRLLENAGGEVVATGLLTALPHIIAAL